MSWLISRKQMIAYCTARYKIDCLLVHQMSASTAMQVEAFLNEQRVDFVRYFTILVFLRETSQEIAPSAENRPLAQIVFSYVKHNTT